MKRKIAGISLAVIGQALRVRAYAAAAEAVANQGR